MITASKSARTMNDIGQCREFIQHNNSSRPTGCLHSGSSLHGHRNVTLVLLAIHCYITQLAAQVLVNFCCYSTILRQFYVNIALGCTTQLQSEVIIPFNRWPALGRAYLSIFRMLPPATAEWLQLVMSHYLHGSPNIGYLKSTLMWSTERSQACLALRTAELSWVVEFDPHKLFYSGKTWTKFGQYTCSYGVSIIMVLAFCAMCKSRQLRSSIHALHSQFGCYIYTALDYMLHRFWLLAQTSILP